MYHLLNYTEFKPLLEISVGSWNMAIKYYLEYLYLLNKTLSFAIVTVLYSTLSEGFLIISK